jgi:hypothetical protein
MLHYPSRARGTREKTKAEQLLDRDKPEHEVNVSKSRCRAPSPEESVEENHPLHLFIDSRKPNFAELDTSNSETGSDVDQDDWEELRTAIEIIQSCTPQL